MTTTPNPIEVASLFAEVVCHCLGVKTDEVQAQSRLVADLGADSFDVIDLMVSTESEFEISIDHAEWEKVATVADAVALILRAMGPNPIDSLPPTDERVGIPTTGDEVFCESCERIGVVFDFTIGGGVAICRCGSYDITGHDVASLRGVRR